MTTPIDLRVAAYAVIERDGHVLLSHWGLGDRWTLPGGGIDPGEHPVDAVIREVREETGYLCEVHELILTDSIVVAAALRMRGGDRDLQSIRIIYRGSIVSGELAHETDGSSDEARWVALAHIARLKRIDLVDQAINAAHEPNAVRRPLRLT